ncbi:response regulator transcription factor [Ktedonosporobacter rubrisoli]|uniref:Response regulator transcription factor n=1 Tax=Ktedonosporobacter rubrisoli TaxID=2509675 RepID=A0A4P6JR34_KTERU|nr:response regulator transcription factor [Ktedonosporobacter rubrisoli]QBD77650.1 response regulator transcription factor [Ktedonosporobacter rubrisoli]
MEQATISIVLADDHTMMREGTRRLLEEDPAFAIVGEARDGAEAIGLCRQFRPRVLVLDIAMKGMNGFAVAQNLLVEEKQQVGILVLTAYDQAAYVVTMLRMGVKGYWLKSASSNAIRQAIRDVAAGKRSIDPEVHQLLTEERSDVQFIDLLTSREQEVLQLVARGLRNSEISERLHVSIKTVETHLTSLYQKLNVQSRTEATALVQEQRLLFDNE